MVAPMYAQPWVEEIHAECLRLRTQLPKSALREAVNYTLKYVKICGRSCGAVLITPKWEEAGLAWR
jgi:hypothetical protein